MRIAGVRGRFGGDDPGGASSTSPLMRWSPAVLAVLGGTLLRSTRLAAARSISCLRAELPPRSKFEGPGSSGEILRAVPR